MADVYSYFFKKFPRKPGEVIPQLGSIIATDLAATA